MNNSAKRLRRVFINFTNGKFEAPHEETLGKWYKGYKEALKEGRGCARCRMKRVKARYKNKIRHLLG